jgi:hypothetical protein
MFFDPFGLAEVALRDYLEARHATVIWNGNITENDHLYATATVSMNGYDPQEFTGRLDTDTNKMMYDSGILDAWVKQANEMWAQSEAVEVSNEWIEYFPIVDYGEAATGYDTDGHKLTTEQLEEKLAEGVQESVNGLYCMCCDGDISGPEFHGTYVKAPYHGSQNSGLKNKAPIDGQSALDHSLPLNSNTDRRISVDNNEFVIFDKTSNGVYHGHVRTWDELTQNMRNVLINAGKVTRKGKIIDPN